MGRELEWDLEAGRLVFKPVTSIESPKEIKGEFKTSGKVKSRKKRTLR